VAFLLCTFGIILEISEGFSRNSDRINSLIKLKEPIVQNTQTNDYTLLRDFNLEDAKAGAAICSGSLMTDLTFLCAHKNSVFVELSASRDSLLLHSDEVKMKPLFWLGGKPVYKGQIIYHTVHGKGIVARKSWVCRDIEVEFTKEHYV